MLSTGSKPTMHACGCVASCCISHEDPELDSKTTTNGTTGGRGGVGGGTGGRARSAAARTAGFTKCRSDARDARDCIRWMLFVYTTSKMSAMSASASNNVRSRVHLRPCLIERRGSGFTTNFRFMVASSTS
eukprot:6185400-Pleurochrysis_carterae.AAC.4